LAGPRKKVDSSEMKTLETLIKSRITQRILAAMVRWGPCEGALNPTYFKNKL